MGKLTRSARTVAGTAIATQLFDHDAAARLVQERWTLDGETHTLATTYDAGGRITSRTYPDGERIGGTANPWS